jgi:hypothetical protein
MGGTADQLSRMPFDAVIWILLPVFVAAGSALLSFFIMQAKLEVAVAKEREALAAAHSQIKACEEVAEQKVKAAEESSKRKAMDDFMQEFRVEERHYVRENKSLLMQKKSVIMQERLFFRNIPLSNWVEHEMVVEEGGDPQQVGRGRSVFTARTITNGAPPATELLRPPTPGSYAIASVNESTPA